jgi:hypothetical protein
MVGTFKNKEERIMSTLLNYLMGLCVYESKFERFRIDRMFKWNKQLIMSITKRQRIKFIVKKIVPLPLLEVLWDMDYLPGNRPPREGMRVNVLLDYMSSHDNYRDKKHRARGIRLRDRIESEEYPEQNLVDDRLVTDANGDSIPIFYLREQSGTIFHR